MKIAQPLKMTKRTVACLAIAATLTGCAAIFPLRFSGAKSIEKRLAGLTPLGSSFEEVTNTLFKRYSSSNIRVAPDTGFAIQHSSGQTEIVGVKSVSLYLGDYISSPISSTGVGAYWGFDPRGRLIRIWVWKSPDFL